MATTTERATVFIEGEEIVRSYREEELLRLEIPEVRVIGEMTNSSGPYADDYFLVLVTFDTWHEVSMNDDGMHDMLQELCMKIGSTLKSNLADPTTFKSRVMWPDELSERELFVYEPAKPKNFLEKIRLSIFPLSKYRLTDEVEQYAARAKK